MPKERHPIGPHGPQILPRLKRKSRKEVEDEVVDKYVYDKGIEGGEGI